MNETTLETIKQINEMSGPALRAYAYAELAASTIVMAILLVILVILWSSRNVIRKKMDDFPVEIVIALYGMIVLGTGAFYISSLFHIITTPELEAFRMITRNILASG